LRGAWSARARENSEKTHKKRGAKRGEGTTNCNIRGNPKRPFRTVDPFFKIGETGSGGGGASKA